MEQVCGNILPIKNYKLKTKFIPEEDSWKKELK